MRHFKTMDGNTAAAHVSYAFTEVAAIYPITPSSPMADYVDQWAAQGRKNIFGTTVKVQEMQAESGAAGAVHGSLNAGALTTTYTASQGLLLMIPNMYKIAGELLPGVFHVSARTVASHTLNIFGDHSDVMACRQTGFAMLAESNVQEVMDLSPVAHLSAIKGRVPFLNFFDGFRTSHEIQKIQVWDYDDLKEMVDMDAVQAFRDRALSSEHPTMRGSHENGDIFFQNREASNKYYDAVPAIVEEYMAKINAKLGTDYQLFNYYGAPDADRVIVAMGSICDVAEEVIDYMNAHGEKVGLIKVRLYRPFCPDKLLAAIPATCKNLAVLDRTKEPGAQGEPLYLDVVTALANAGRTDIRVIGGRYGLGSKDTPPASVFAVYNELTKAEPKRQFTIGIVDDVTNLSLKEEKAPATAAEGTIECKFWGLGGDGTVGANKNSIKIIGDNTDQYVQAYFEYDTKKSGGVTKSHLRFGHNPILSTYYVTMADFVACHNESYVKKYDIVNEIKPGGTFLLNTVWKGDELVANLPNKLKRILAERKIRFYTIDATDIAAEIGLGNRTNTVLQSAFFKLSGVLPIDDAVKYMKDAITKTSGKKGEKVLNMNYTAVDRGLDGIVEVPVDPAWAKLPDEVQTVNENQPDYIKTIMHMVNGQRGDLLPVSAWKDMADGTVPIGTAKYEKRGFAAFVPEWDASKCIGCNMCSFYCPHAAIRPFLLNAEEVAKAPASYVTNEAKGKGFEGLRYRLQVDPLDCTGCGTCVTACLAKDKALSMKPIASQLPEAANWEFSMGLSEKQNPMNKFSAKGSQFEQPLLEFSGACAGCGETAYMKLLTQLYGDRMIIANATGCTQAWGFSIPSYPYATNSRGHGPAISNSLSENNAEYSLGMVLSIQQQRLALATKAKEYLETAKDESLKAALEAWLAGYEDDEKARELADAVLTALDKTSDCGEQVEYMKQNSEHFVRKSMWMYGGDGWAYDIGYGGLDHVLASGIDVNILVVDTEVYSNTGGQASKATPIGAVAQFAAAGKRTVKKDLGLLAAEYGDVYVASIALGANPNQAIKAIQEAVAHKGPSLIIAYAPCINHGIVKGMGYSTEEAKLAVDSGYWFLYRYVPALRAEGKNPFVLDSKEPTVPLEDFLNGEVRYASLRRTFPDQADALLEKAKVFSAERYQKYRKLAEN